MEWLITVALLWAFVVSHVVIWLWVKCGRLENRANLLQYDARCYHELMAEIERMRDESERLV